MNTVNISFSAIVAYIIYLMISAHYSEALTLQPILIRGAGGVSKLYAEKYVKEANKVYITQVTHEHVVVLPIIIVNVDPSKRYNTLGLYGARLGYLRAWVNRHYRRRGANLVHIILPPIYENQKYWLGGYATVCNYYTGLSIANALNKNSFAEPRDKQTITAIAHEVCHVLGCGHIVGDNLMDPAALKYVTAGEYPLQVLKQSKCEVQSCRMGECYE